MHPPQLGCWGICTFQAQSAQGNIPGHSVLGNYQADDGSVQVRELDGNLLDISDFSVYARLRLMSNEGRVYHTVRDDVPEPEIVKPVSGGPNVIRPEDWR